jgi:hypothetical protein
MKKVVFQNFETENAFDAYLSGLQTKDGYVSEPVK